MNDFNYPIAEVACGYTIAGGNKLEPLSWKFRKAARTLRKC